MRPIYTIYIILTLIMFSCRGTKEAGAAVESDEPISKLQPAVETLTPSAAMPKAVIYKTNGNYNEHVFVNMNGSRTRILSFPAPEDVSQKSEPVQLTDGWLLDRRGGIGTNSVFLRYTYVEYNKLPNVPSIAELKENIIDSAKVIAIKQLPISASQAIANPELVKQYINF